MTIHTLSLSCLQNLSQIVTIAKRPHYLQRYDSAVSAAAWNDELDRLYKWTMNTGAGQTGTISIETRFRNPAILPKYRFFGCTIARELEDLEILLRIFINECVVQGPGGEGRRRGEAMVKSGCYRAVQETWDKVVLTISCLRQSEHGVPKLADMGRR